MNAPLDNTLEAWVVFFQTGLPEATEAECRELAQAGLDHVHQGHMIINQATAETHVRNQATADFLNSLPRGGD